MLYAVLFSLLFVVGVGLIVLPPSNTPIASIDLGVRRELAIRVAGAIAAGVLVLVVSGWVLPAVVVGAGAFWVIGGWQRRETSSTVEIRSCGSIPWCRSGSISSARMPRRRGPT